VLDEDGLPMHFAQTRLGVVAAWTTSPVAGRGVGIRALDRDGRAVADARTAPAAGAIFGVVISSTPDGGALLAWQENPTEAPQWRLRVQSLDSDGNARGAPSTITLDAYADSWDLIVDGSGARALYVGSRDGAVLEALPLRCAD
jgi:dipeptidyl aminopeptidase/acylaminoacyl peptidase